MSVRRFLNDRGRVIRRVALVAGEPTIDSTIGDWFPFDARVPRVPLTGVQMTNPRSVSNTWGLQWAAGYRDPGPITAGFRVELSSGTVLEVLAPPTALKEATERITGWAALAQELSVLYPLSGTIQEPGEIDGQPIICAIWEFREDQDRMGRFENFRGRVPIEFKGVARVNHEIVVDDVAYKINEAVTNSETMTIDLTLVKPHG